MNLRFNGKLKATGALLATALAVGACTALVIARILEQRAIGPPPYEQGFDAQWLGRSGVTGEDLLGPGYVSIQRDRTDVPWQVAPTEDPDRVRSF
ncbi:MAG: hypothetical protein ACM3IK_10410 [Sphingomonadaceae bacterium]